jgi:hypothetical protein
MDYSISVDCEYGYVSRSCYQDVLLVSAFVVFH